MTNINFAALLSVSVNVSPTLVVAEVRDARPDHLALFGALDDAQREGLVHEAWTIGIRALRSAHLAAQEARLEDIGGALVEDFKHQLQQHVTTQQKTMVEALAELFFSLV